MPDPSAIPFRSVDDARQAKSKGKVDGTNAASLPSISSAGPRKLIRPRLPAGTPLGRYSPGASTVHGNHNQWTLNGAAGSSSHAEAFYFQKQIQSQTLMVFLLDDGEQLEGHIEWYDRDAIKVRCNGTRTLVYKTCIKYLYKASDSTRT